MKYTKKLITSKLPQLRALKYYGGKTFPTSKITDEVLVECLFVILNSKGLYDEFEILENDDYGSFFKTEELIKRKFIEDLINKIKKEKFDLKVIYAIVNKIALDTTNISMDFPDNFICTFYHTPSEEFKKIFPKVNSHVLYENYSLNSMMKYEVIDYVSKNRNLPGVKLAHSIDREKLVGKFVVTEENVLFGFMKSMTLKFNGFLPGKITEVRYGERHGLDNFWDDKVHSRDFLVLKLNNITGSKSIKKLKEGLWAVDLTTTIQVFDTMDEAVEIANQLNEFHKKSLTLY